MRLLYGRGRTAGALAGTLVAFAAAAQPDAPLEPPGERPATWLARLWDLDRAERGASFRLRPHHANYFLPASASNRRNRSPSSPAPGRTVPAPLPYESTEAKFQLSVKFRMVEDLLGGNGDLWFGYTQQSHWQMYNRDASSPFRETNHEPEAILSLRTYGELAGWRWRVLNLGFLHQSNGRELPQSRSWNRVYAAFGFERSNLALWVRPWISAGDREDNPDILDYVGRGDVRLSYARTPHIVSLLARYGGGGRGLLQLDWTFSIVRSLNGYLQVTHGYGESLIDYNHRQTTLGFGILLLPWE